MRLANEIAAAAMEHVRGELRPGMTCAQAAAAWQAYVHGEGTGWRGVVELALPFSLVWSGPSIRTFTATSSAPVLEGEPTLFEIWVCADGYWADHTKNLVCGELTPRYAELEQGLVEVYDEAVALARPGGSLADMDRRVRAGIAELGFPGQPTHPICHGIGARAHEPPYAHQAADIRDPRGHGARHRARLLLAGGWWAARRGQLPRDRRGPRQAEPVPRWDRPCPMITTPPRARTS